jgi:hypothetical protein
VKEIDLRKDIYYSNSYISLYLKENEEIFEFIYEEDNDFFINKAIKRPILKIGNLNVNGSFYDLETAYGYGGFYTNSDNMNFLKRAMEKYEKKCQQENIIAEFIRFHPFNNFPLKYPNLLDFNLYDRDIIIKVLDQDILKSYNSKVRNIIKRATEKVDIKESDNLDKFIEIYNQTMKKNNADDFYFFSRKYYEQLIQNPNIKLYEVLYKSKVIAMGFFMFGEFIAHYHLSANTFLSYKLNANYALLNYAFNEAKKRGISYFLLGGGTTTLKEDTLFKFKKKFSKELKPFYISGKVYNEKIYNEYIQLWQQQTKQNIKYFLKYRLEIQ